MQKTLLPVILIALIFFSTTASAECVDNTALANYILRWKTDSSVFTMPMLMQKIADWKSGAGCTTNTCSSISQYGITWTFDHAYPCGQFVNGDWWVVGRVTVQSVSPAPTGSGTSFRNGSMVNPDMKYVDSSTYQGYDGRADGYASAYSKSFPLTLDPSDGTKSLVSTESILSYPFNCLADSSPSDSPDHLHDPMPYGYYTRFTTIDSPINGTLRNAAILTIVATPPQTNSFRPPFVGTTKPIFSTNNLQTSLLPGLSLDGITHKPNSTDLANLVRVVQRPWISVQKRDWMSVEIGPLNNEISYGRDLADALGDAALIMVSNYSQEQKKPILYGMIQQGIDTYYAVQLDHDLFYNNGGFRQGRKFEILLAGLMLNNSALLSVDGTFQEDQMFFYGEDHNPPITLWTGWASQPKPYTDVKSNNVMRRFDYADNRGIWFEWEQYPPNVWHLSPFPFNPGPTTHQYPWARPDGYARDVTRSMIGQVLAAKILGLQTYWNHDATFDYIDRWMNENDLAVRTAEANAAAQYNWDSLETDYSSYGWDYSWANPNARQQIPGQDAISPFHKEMYLKYRSQYVGGQTLTASFIATPLSGTVPLTVNFDASASRASQGKTITSYQWDFENDGIVDATGMTASHIYNTAGSYTVKLTITDNSNATASTIRSITVTGAEPLAISNIQVSSVSSSSAVIIWTTNKLATSKVDYGLDSSYGSSTTLDPSLTTSHSVTISALSPNTTYHYRVRSKDASGNETISGDISFTTGSVPTDGLQVWLSFDGSADDVSGNHNNGVLYGSPVFTQNRNNEIGKALQLDGTDDYVDLGTSDFGIYQSQQFSVVAWVKPQGAGSIIRRDAYIAPFSIYSQGAGGNFEFVAYARTTNPQGNYLYSSGLAYGAWHLVALTYGNGIQTLYVDGAIADSESGLNSLRDVSNVHTFIGRLPEYQDYFTGAIDDLRIYNTALTQAQIQALSS